MTRRELLIALGLAVVGGPYPALAQTPPRLPTVGMLWTHVPATDPDLDRYREYFRELGYEEGRNLTLTVLSAEGRLDQLPVLANDLISRGADVIMTTNDVSTRAAQRATTKIPIVMVGLGSDPVSLGFVDNLRRPGGNITGTYSLIFGLENKRLEILKQAMPQLTSAGADDPAIHAVSNGLRELGYVEGHDFRFEYRGAQGQVDRLPRLAEELVQLKVDFIIVGTEAALLAAKQSTGTIPIVAALFDYDPVAAGLVESLAHPGGNITGVFTRAPELIGKRLELLKEAVPSLSRVAVFYDSYGQRQIEDVRSASRSLGIHLVLMELRPPHDYKLSFKIVKQKKADAVIFLYAPDFYVLRESIAQHALQNRLPMIGYASQFARAGFFMSYGTDAWHTFGRLAYFIDRLLKGATPNDLPFEQPTKFEMVVNLKTANAIGIRVPQSILLRADEVIR